MRDLPRVQLRLAQITFKVLDCQLDAYNFYQVNLNQKLFSKLSKYIPSKIIKTLS
jgi:hypothetical protein